MANKEAIIIALDVGRSMKALDKTQFKAATRAIGLLVQQKVLFYKSHQVGLITFGSTETDNDLAESLGGYENVNVKRPIDVPSVAFLKELQDIEPEGENADFIDALVVATDLALKMKGKFKKRLFLVTDAGCKIEDASDAVEHIKNTFSQNELALNIIGLDFDDIDDEDPDSKPSEGKDPDKIANEALLRSLANDVGGVVMPVTQAVQMISYFRSKTVSQISKYRGPFEMGPDLSVPVWAFSKTMEAKFPTLGRRSILSAQSVEPGQGEVEMETSYYSLDPNADPDAQLGEDELIRAYKYGKAQIPWDKEEEKSMQFQAEKGLQLLGFTDSSKIRRHHIMGTVDCIVSEPGNDKAGEALSAFAQAMFESDTVAIVRFAPRNGMTSIKLCAMLPVIKDGSTYFHLVQLPFAEDLRFYEFPSLSANEKNVPSEDQKLAARNLVDALDLMQGAEDDDGDRVEALKPKYLYNPITQRFYETCTNRALDPEAPLATLDEDLRRYVEPDQELMERAAAEVKAFKESFTLKKNANKEKAKRRFWSDMPEEEPADKKVKAEDIQNMKEMLLGTKVTTVGTVNPEDDFTVLIDRARKQKDSDGLTKAFDSMEKTIMELVVRSIRDSLYKKAVDCLRLLRKTCISVDGEVERFNDFLRKIREEFEGKSKKDFWQRVMDEKISLITDNETPGGVPSLEAEQFLSQSMEQSAPDVTMEDDDDDNLTDLLADAE